MNVTKDIRGHQYDRKDRMVLTYCLSTLLLFILIDLLADYDRKLSLSELLADTFLEIGILALTLFMSKYLWSRFTSETMIRVRVQQGLDAALDTVRQFEHRERSHALDIKHYCEEKYGEWAMTKSEREVASLLMGPRSIGQISAYRFTSEGTIKNQARSIYHKAGVKNRVEFMALFIDHFGIKKSAP